MMRLVSLLALVLALLPATARAQYDSSDSYASRDYEFATRMQNDFMSNFQRSLVDPVAREVRRKGASPARPARPVLAAPVTGDRSVVRKLAQAYPPAARAQAESLFGTLLGKYPQMEQAFGIPRGDLAGAVASSLAGNWMALNARPLPDAHFQALVIQLRTILSDNAAFGALTGPQRQEIYQTLAINGLMMAGAAEALQKRPDPAAAARLRASAKASLEQWFPGETDAMRITAKGLEFAR